MTPLTQRYGQLIHREVIERILCRHPVAVSVANLLENDRPLHYVTQSSGKSCSAFSTHLGEQDAVGVGVRERIGRVWRASPPEVESGGSTAWPPKPDADERQDLRRVRFVPASLIMGKTCSALTSRAIARRDNDKATSTRLSPNRFRAIFARVCHAAAPCRSFECTGDFNFRDGPDKLHNRARVKGPSLCHLENQRKEGRLDQGSTDRTTVTLQGRPRGVATQLELQARNGESCDIRPLRLQTPGG